MNAREKLLLDAWQKRDELFAELFGEYSKEASTHYEPPKPKARKKKKVDPGGSADPGEESTTLSVLAYAPDPLRPYWLYVTAGMSNPWYQDEPQEVSGFGFEMMLKSPEQSAWPVQILRTMALYVFNHAGTLSPGVRIALNGPVSVVRDSPLTNLFIWYADEAPDCWYQLPSGGFGLFTAIGITDDELAFAESIEEYGTWCVNELLRQTGVNQTTDPDRTSVMLRPDIDKILEPIKNYAINFRSMC